MLFKEVVGGTMLLTCVWGISSFVVTMCELPGVFLFSRKHRAFPEVQIGIGPKMMQIGSFSIHLMPFGSSISGSDVSERTVNYLSICGVLVIFAVAILISSNLMIETLVSPIAVILVLDAIFKIGNKTDVSNVGSKQMW